MSGYRPGPDPTPRARMRVTLHRDGTVSHYSYSYAGWFRTPLLALSSEDIEDMVDADQARARAARSAAKASK